MGLNKPFFSKNQKPVLNMSKVENIIRQALAEDIGRGDITTRLAIPAVKKVAAALIVKEDCLICGLPVVEKVFKIVDKNIKFKPLTSEGRQLKRGQLAAKVFGRARSILIAERAALNILSMLSGIAAKTREFVKQVDKYKVKIIDTRKTLPGLRELQKYAVRVGGGYNHRMSLDEMLLVKDNHFKIMGDGLWITGLKEIKNKIPPKIRMEVEVKTLAEFKKALKIEPSIIMLDNMSIKNIKKAVKMRNNLKPRTYNLKPKLEASGGITLRNVRKFAATGVDMISVGALTHSFKAIDISLEIL